MDKTDYYVKIAAMGMSIFDMANFSRSYFSVAFEDIGTEYVEQQADKHLKRMIGLLYNTVVLGENEEEFEENE